MTVHLLALPHTETTRAYSWCAYTDKVRKMATMLTRLGERVIVYGGEGNDAECAAHVPIVTRAEQAAWFPGWDPNSSTWDPPRAWETDAPWWQAYNERAAAAIRIVAEPRDVLAVSMGTSHRPVSDALADIDLLRVETGIGYKGVWAPFRVYESWAWRHYVTGNREADDVVRFYDEVIPNYFEAEQFPEGQGDGGYFLFIGRLVSRKGPHIAAQACARLGAKLVMAGQGAVSWSNRKIVCRDGTILEGDVEYAGVVGPEERAKLMGGAIAAFVPTLYLEPFGGVSVEAQLTGTPAIVSDYGGLTENVNGVGGFRCRTLAEFTQGAAAAASLDRERIREHALATWSTDVIGPRYVEYFRRLAGLYEPGVGDWNG